MSIFPQFLLSWANGASEITVTLRDADVPLIFNCADTPQSGTNSALDLTTATSVTLSLTAINSGTVKVVTAGALNASQGAYNLQASDILSLGVGIYECGLDCTLPSQSATFQGAPNCPVLLNIAAF